MGTETVIQGTTDDSGRTLNGSTDRSTPMHRDFWLGPNLQMLGSAEGPSQSMDDITAFQMSIIEHRTIVADISMA